jgi:hypothetical protein
VLGRDTRRLHTAFWSAGDSFCQVFSEIASGIGL